MSIAFKNPPNAPTAKACPSDASVSQDFQYERSDWVLFRSAATLPQKAGVPLDLLRQLVIKEVADNGLDAGGDVRVGRIEGEEDGYFIEDDGPGIPPEDVARLFSINRPLVSSKLWRMPTRGAMGNGLRVVMGAVAASTGGALRVITRNRRLDLTPEADGGTSAMEAVVDHPVGTRVEIVFGPEIPRDESATRWADAAIRMNRGSSYQGKSAPHWYDADSFYELLQAAGARPVRSLVAELDGCSGATAGRITAAVSGRSCGSLSRPEATEILLAARSIARKVRPERLGEVGPVEFLPPVHTCERGEFRTGARDPLAEAPFAVEAWVGAQGKSSRDTIAVFVNRTPITGRVTCWRDKNELVLYGPSLYRRLQLPKLGLDITVNVTTPYCPIITDGKEPDLNPFAESIGAAIEKAARKACRDAKEPAVERITAKALVLAQLDEAIAMASGDGMYRFNQRQLFYVVRPSVMAVLGVELLYKNFEAIITDYETVYGDIPGMYRDPRGTLYHPHVRQTIPIGTLAVETYDRPAWAFNKIVYIEKEGPFEALKAAKWPERHDCALLTSKGFSTRAVKDLLDLLGEGGELVTVFCAHDADAAGTMIHQTLQGATRARPSGRAVEIVNLGLDPWEAMEMGLEVERFEQRSRSSAVAQYVLDRHDGTLWRSWLQENRIELNAMTTPQLIAWLDRKMSERSGVKVIPPADVLEARMLEKATQCLRDDITKSVLRRARIEDRVRETVQDLPPPDGRRLALELADWLADHPEETWSTFIDNEAARQARSR